MLLLAGISIVGLFGDNGLFTRTKQAKENTLDAQNAENLAIYGYNNEINELVTGTREQVTVDKDEYEKMKEDVEELKNNLVYKPGDTYNCERLLTIGYITSSSKNVHFTISLDKKISASVSNIKISSAAFNIRHPDGKYLINSEVTSLTGAKANIGNYFEFKKTSSENYISFIYAANTGLSCTNNVPLSVEILGLVLEFE